MQNLKINFQKINVKTLEVESYDFCENFPNVLLTKLKNTVTPRPIIRKLFQYYGTGKAQ